MNITSPRSFIEKSGLPDILPVFPLQGVVMLPQSRLPLNVFEPRYMSMVQDVLGSPARMIGVIQPTEMERPGDAPPRLYQVGCAGRITSFNETEDGRFLINLTGVCRFAVAHELETALPYRSVKVDWDKYQSDFEEVRDEDVDRKRLTDVLQNYFRTHEIAADWNAVQGTPTDALISSLVMICPLSPSEKQALLESKNLQSRADMLMTLLSMANFNRPDGEGGVRH